MKMFLHALSAVASSILIPTADLALELVLQSHRNILEVSVAMLEHTMYFRLFLCNTH